MARESEPDINSKPKRERFLNAWWILNSESFTEFHQLHNGVGKEMILAFFKENRGFAVKVEKEAGFKV